MLPLRWQSLAMHVEVICLVQASPENACKPRFSGDSPTSTRLCDLGQLHIGTWVPLSKCKKPSPHECRNLKISKQQIDRHLYEVKHGQRGKNDSSSEVSAKQDEGLAPA